MKRIIIGMVIGMAIAVPSAFAGTSFFGHAYDITCQKESSTQLIGCFQDHGPYGVGITKYGVAVIKNGKMIFKRFQ